MLPIQNPTTPSPSEFSIPYHLEKLITLHTQTTSVCEQMKGQSIAQNFCILVWDLNNWKIQRYLKIKPKTSPLIWIKDRVEDTDYIGEQEGFPVLCLCVRTLASQSKVVFTTAGPYYRVVPLSLFGRNQSRIQFLCSQSCPKKNRYGQSFACTIPCLKLVNQLNYPSDPLLFTGISHPTHEKKHLEWEGESSLISLSLFFS